MQIIEAGVIAKDYWRNLWNRRELIYFLVRRDLIVRYKQTIIGLGWVVIRPFLTMVVFTVIFGALANLDSNGLPYSFLVFAGVIPWYLFSNVLSDSSNCLLANSNLLNKVYFPRLVFAISIFFVTLVDFTVSFILLICMMFWFHITPAWELILFPIFILTASALGLGIGLISATLNVKFRDFQQLIPFMLQLGIYLSPVGYLNQLVKPNWELIYSLNPMAGIINGFRWCLMPDKIVMYWPGFIYSMSISLVFLYIGIQMFRASEARFTDTI
jgi:lipopolysaccharide transport system permease protein